MDFITVHDELELSGNKEKVKQCVNKLLFTLGVNFPPRQPQKEKSRVPGSQFKQPSRMLRQIL
jgi:hypothetical protein